MHEINDDEEDVPKRGVQPADNRPGPEREEGTADEEGAAQIEHAVQPARRQVRQEEERVRQLEVDVVHVDALVRLASEGSVEKAGRH